MEQPQPSPCILHKGWGLSDVILKPETVLLELLETLDLSGFCFRLAPYTCLSSEMLLLLHDVSNLKIKQQSIVP